MELKDFKEYAINILLEYEQLNNELRTLRETYIEALNNFYKDNRVFFCTDKEEFTKEFLNGEIFNKANSLLVHSALINEVENNVKCKYSELVEAFNMLDKLWERKEN
jgi:centrosomal protein 290kDa